jgi:hypothetical protein
MINIGAVECFFKKELSRTQCICITLLTYTDPEKELDHAFYKKRLPLTIQMLQEVGIIYAQNVQKNVKNICAR